LYKLVTLNYRDQAQIVVKASTDDEAREAVIDAFPEVPELVIISVEPATDEMVETVKANMAEDGVTVETERTLN
jgi:chemotaxis response regulator CheB